MDLKFKERRNSAI